MRRRADDHIIGIHAIHIVKIDGKENRKKAISLFNDTYDDNSTALLKKKITDLFPLRKKAAQ